MSGIEQGCERKQGVSNKRAEATTKKARAYNDSNEDPAWKELFKK